MRPAYQVDHAIPIPQMMSPAFEILLACCRAKPDAVCAERLAALSGQGPDWDEVLRLARRHGMLPQLHALLAESAWSAVPARISEELKTFFRENLIRNLSMLRELFRLLDAFAREGLCVLPVKGPVLAIQAYGDPALRSYGDLDLLIAPADLPGAYHLLCAAGYVPEIQLEPGSMNVFAKSEKYLVLTERRTGLSVELQWDFLPGYFGRQYDFDALWLNRQTVTMEARRVATLSDADTVRFLCLHGFKHGWDRLGLVSDLAHLLARVDLRDTACSRPVTAGLLLVERLVPGTITGMTMTELHRDSVSNRMARQWADELSGGKTGRARILANGRMYLSGQEGIVNKASFLRRLLFTPTVEDWKYWTLNKRHWLYPALRPVRLLTQHVLRSRA